MSASRWYALAAAVVLLALAFLNTWWATLIVAALGCGVGFWLARRGPLGRSGVIGLAGFGIAAGLAVFALTR